MTRRKPSEYNFATQDFDDRLLPTSGAGRRVTSPRRGKISHIDIHHMTIHDSNNGAAIEGCLSTWKSRAASAHYGIDNDVIAQFVYDSNEAWADANGPANQTGVAIEHANSKLGPTWEISEKTLANSVKLVAGLHITHKLGRPHSSGFGDSGTIRTHQSFYATACPGPYFEKIWADYVDRCAKEYDRVVNGVSTPTTPTPVAAPVWGKPETWKIGGVSDDVLRLAEALVVHGQKSFYSNGTDRTFTAGEDQKAVKAFQEAQGWSGGDADGFPGNQTFALLAADPVVQSPIPPAQTGTAMRKKIMTFNSSDKLGNTVTRAKAVVESVLGAKTGHPDIVCFQELTGRKGSGVPSSWAKLIDDELPNNYRLFVPTTDFNENYIAINQDTTEHVQMLADHIIQVFGATRKHCTRLITRDISSGKTLLVGNTHIDPYTSVSNRVKQMLDAYKSLKDVYDEGGIDDFVLCGDFNDPKFPSELVSLNQREIGTLAQNKINWSGESFSGTDTGLGNASHIDYIVVNRNETVHTAELVRILDASGKKLKSPKAGDHQPILGDITFN